MLMTMSGEGRCARAVGGGNEGRGSGIWRSFLLMMKCELMMMCKEKLYLITVFFWGI